MELPDISWVKDHLGRGLSVTLALFALVISAYEIEKPYAWVVALCSFGGLILVTFFFKAEPSAQEIDSDKWFGLITRHLDDASGAYIYLVTLYIPTNSCQSIVNRYCLS